MQVQMGIDLIFPLSPKEEAADSILGGFFGATSSVGCIEIAPPCF